jgi:hypothetical protein
MALDMSRLRIGLFSVGLDAYWPQFAGLKATRAKLQTNLVPAARS